MKWQPIETAPKDGTRFLAGWRWEFGTKKDWCYAVMFYSSCGDEFLVDWDYADDVWPTHWKPIKRPKME